MMSKIEIDGIEYIYHMTYISNLSSILKSGLLSHYEVNKRGLNRTDISDQNVQDIRAHIIDPIYKRPLHQYVPLYFCPRNPMLYRRREMQEDIVILGFSPKILSEPNIIFTDGNAAATETLFYHEIQMLGQLPWESIKARSWTNIKGGKRIKCAEILVYPKIQPDKIQVIFCYSNKHRESIIAAKQGTSIIGKVNKELYF